MLVIHIGMKKAGSASIQSFLTMNDARLKLHSIDYPSAGRPGRKDHHNLYSEIIDRKKFLPELGTINDVVEHMACSDYRTTIISSEMFEGATAEAVGVLKTKLSATLEPIRIVMIVRDLISLLPSSYAQKVRFGINSHDFDEFFDNRIGEARVHFSDTAEIWADQFGWENLRIIDLNAPRASGTDLMDDFLRATGAARTAGADWNFPRPGIMNASSGWRVLEAIRALHSGRHQLPENHFVIRFLDARGENSLQRRKKIEGAAVEVGEARGWNKEKGRYMTRAQAQSCLDIHQQSTLTLNSRLSTPLTLPLDLETRGFIERDFMPDVTNISADELRGFYDDLAQVLKRLKANFVANKAAKLARRAA
jgi:hypothetical protein